MLSLTAEKRDVFGNDLVASRLAGRMPVVVYGAKDKTTPLFIDAKTFKKVWAEAGESSIISLKTPSGDKDVLIHDTAFHPVSGEPLHADFYVIDVTKPIQVKVPLVFEGVSEAVKSMGGVLVKVLHELEIEILPKELPHSLAVDLSLLATLGSHISVKDITLPPSAKLVARPDDIIISVALPKEEKVEEVAEPVDLSKIEVEKKGKEEPAPGEATEGNPVEAGKPAK